MITLTIPNDDHIALRAFGKALEEMALAHGAPSTQLQVVNEITMTGEQTEALRERLNKALGEPEVDTTAQQVESLAGTYPGTPTPDATYETIAEKMFFDVVRTDNSGTPWDERIHSASKALNADGTWRLRRKPKDMDEAEWAALVESVKCELHTQTPVMMDEEVKVLEFVEIGEPTREEVDEASNKMLEPPVTPPGDDFHTDTGVVTEQTVVGIPPLPVPPPVVVAPPVPEVTTWDFPRLMTFLTERHGKIDVVTVNTLLAQDGMSSVQELNTHPDKIGPFVARVKAHLGE